MIGFKHVKFSRGTAKKNPDMIIREYERLITNLKSNCTLLYNKDIKITLNLDWINSIIQRIKYRIPIDDFDKTHLYKDATVNMTYEELKSIITEIETHKFKEINTLNLIRQIEEEAHKFRMWVNRH